MRHFYLPGQRSGGVGHICKCGGNMYRIFAGDFKFGKVFRCRACGLIFKRIKPKIPEGECQNS